MHIAVIGLGRLGAPLAAVLAEAGHHVIGVDRRPDVVASLEAGAAPVREPGLAALLASHRGRIRATTDAAAASAAADATFLVVPTPSTADGTFSSALVLAAVEAAAPGLRGRSRYHLITVTSTVTPGCMAGEVLPALERASGRAVGDSIGLCYNPEFVALGQVVQGMTQPDFVLIGESDERAGRMLESIQRSVVGASIPIARMDFINAEVTKLAVNGYITTKISYANMLAELCERLPGGDANAVTSALGLDRRIGRLCLRGGLAYGGPCLPRDNQALMAVAARCGARADLPAATHALNQHHGERLLQIVARHRAPGRDRIGILGLAYKADTPVIEASPGVLLANRLAEATETGAGTGSGSGAAAGARTATVTVFDPQALPGARPHLHPRVAIAESAAACVAAADIAIITAPWPEFAGIASSIVRRRGERPVVIDCWRMLDRERLRGLAEVVYLGEAWESACPVTQPVSS